MEKFKEYLFRKLQEFERDAGHRVSLQDFADYIGVSRPSISLWLQGRVKPSYENAEVLSKRFGPEVLEILEYDVPNPSITFIESKWDQLDPNVQDQIIKLIQESTATYNAKNTLP